LIGWGAGIIFDSRKPKGKERKTSGNKQNRVIILVQKDVKSRGDLSDDLGGWERTERDLQRVRVLFRIQG
jgi:hypothetical protein